MKLENLPKTIKKNNKRIGRGPGSGKGKTAGRGTKGQKARGGLSVRHSHYEGGQRPLFKRLPYRRGKGNPKVTKKPIVVNLEALNLIPAGEKVNLATLVKFKIVEKKDAQIFGVKILGDGRLSKALTINLPISKSAAQKVQKAGGKIQAP